MESNQAMVDFLIGKSNPPGSGIEIIPHVWVEVTQSASEMADNLERIAKWLRRGRITEAKAIELVRWY